jgi:type VI secretion system FHA domain protein
MSARVGATGERRGGRTSRPYFDRGSGLGNMTLRLRIVSDHRRLLGDRSNIVFAVDGGTIGRSADNDWVLPDPLRYVSAHHARVEYRDGHYYLEELSTNGIFVNDDERPLAKALPAGHLLKTGDLIRMGDYHIVAAVETEAEQPAASVQADTGAGAVPTSIHALKTLGRASAQTDIGAMLNLDDLLVPDTSPGPTFHPVNAYGQLPHWRPRLLLKKKPSNAGSHVWRELPGATPKMASARPLSTTFTAACRRSAVVQVSKSRGCRRTLRLGCCISLDSSSAKRWWD